MAKKKTERNNKIIELRKKGKSCNDIARFYNLTPQRIHQISKSYEKEVKEIVKSDVDYKVFEGKDFLREKVRVRDNHTCQICGKVWKEGTRRFDVHHLDKEIEGKKAFIYKNNKCFDKMKTLCHKCHLNLDNVKNKMSERMIKSWEERRAV